MSIRLHYQKKAYCRYARQTTATKVTVRECQSSPRRTAVLCRNSRTDELDRRKERRRTRRRVVLRSGSPRTTSRGWYLKKLADDGPSPVPAAGEARRRADR